jgi:hypothetical protein
MQSPAYNDVVGASARLRRAPEYTARRLWCTVDEEDGVRQSKAKNRSCLAPLRQPPNVRRKRRKRVDRSGRVAAECDPAQCAVA